MMQNIQDSMYFISKENSKAWELVQKTALFQDSSCKKILIFGESGTGKSRLLFEAAKISKNAGKKAVCHLSAERFYSDLLHALTSKSIRSLRNALAEADILLLDNIQELEGSVYAQQELSGILSRLESRSIPVIITCDRPNVRLLKLVPSLAKQLTENTMVEITPMGYAVRVALLHQLAKEAGMPMESPGLKCVLHYIADKYGADPQEMKNSFLRIIWFSKVLEEEVTLDFANRILSKNA